MPETNPIKIERFLLHTVAAWATQARILAIESEEAERLKNLGRIHRSEQSTEPHPYSGGPCVRVYHCWTVKATKVNPKPKIHQEQKRVIVKDYATPKQERVTVKDYATPKQKRVIVKDSATPSQDRSSTKDDMFFVSIGTPLRQLAWSHKKRIEAEFNGKGEGLQVFVSAFLVPLATYEEIISKAELSTEGTADYQNVDPASPDQYGIRKVREFVDDIVPGTLITYVENDSTPFVKEQGPCLGDVRPMSMLREMVGLPEGYGFKAPEVDMDILVNRKDGKFPGVVLGHTTSGVAKTRGSQSYSGFADECAHAIGLWLGFERGRGLLRPTFETRSVSEFEGFRDAGLKKFLARFGYELPRNWRVYADRPREGVESSDPEREEYARLALDPVMKVLDDDGAKERFFEAAVAFERALGIYLSTCPEAVQAASDMCHGLFARLLPEDRLELSEIGRDPDSSGSVGSDPFQLELVVRQGNLREKLTWVLCVIRSDFSMASKAFESELFALAKRLAKVAETVIPKKGDQSKRYPVIPKMRDETGERDKSQRIERSGTDKLTTMRELDVQYPPMSIAERRHALDGEGRLLWEPGSRVFGFHDDAPYRTESDEKLRPIAAGASGTAYAMMYIAYFLGVDLLHARLALLSWMLTGEDHTFHEIMEGCARWGRDNRVESLAYHGGDTPRRYRALSPLSQYDLRRFVCPNGQFPDELV